MANQSSNSQTLSMSNNGFLSEDSKLKLVGTSPYASHHSVGVEGDGMTLVSGNQPSTSGSSTTSEKTPLYRDPLDAQTMLPGMKQAYKSLISSVGEDPDRQGLKKTPERAAKALMFFTKGYEQNIQG